MIVNLLLMVLIDLPIIKFTCQHHVSGYVPSSMTSGFLFYQLLLQNFDDCTLFFSFFFVQHEKQTLSYIHTKFEGNKNNFGGTHFLAPTLKTTLASEVDAPVITWYD